MRYFRKGFQVSLLMIGGDSAIEKMGGTCPLSSCRGYQQPNHPMMGESRSGEIEEGEMMTKSTYARLPHLKAGG